MAAIFAGLLGGCSSSKIKPEANGVQTATQTTESSSSQATAKEDQVTTAAAATQNIDPLHDPANILSKRKIYFDYNQYAVKPEYNDIIQAHAMYINSHPQARLVLEGNADNRGSREYNLALGQKRAAAVKKLINLYGASDSQTETISYGEERPEASGDDESAWKLNRRVDIRYNNE